MSNKFQVGDVVMFGTQRVISQVVEVTKTNIDIEGLQYLYVIINVHGKFKKWEHELTESCQHPDAHKLVELLHSGPAVSWTQPSIAHAIQRGWDMIYAVLATADKDAFFVLVPCDGLTHNEAESVKLHFNQLKYDSQLEVVNDRLFVRVSWWYLMPWAAALEAKAAMAKQS